MEQLKRLFDYEILWGFVLISSTVYLKIVFLFFFKMFFIFLQSSFFFPRNYS